MSLFKSWSWQQWLEAPGLFRRRSVTALCLNWRRRAACSRSVNLLRSERAQSCSLSSSAATSSDPTSDRMPQKYHQLLQADFLSLDSAWYQRELNETSSSLQRDVAQSLTQPASLYGSRLDKNKTHLNILGEHDHRLPWVTQTFGFRSCDCAQKKGPLIHHLTLLGQMKPSCAAFSFERERERENPPPKIIIMAQSNVVAANEAKEECWQKSADWVNL